MSDTLLWYLARVTGLMAWIVACGSLAAGMVSGALRTRPTPAATVARDASRFLSLTTLAFVATHGAAVGGGSLYGIDPTMAASGRSAGRWLDAGLVAGVVGGWLALAIAAAHLLPTARRGNRPVAHRPGRMLTVGSNLAAAATVGLGGFHAWRWGSDVQNPVTIVLATAVVLAVGATAGLVLRAGREPPLIPLAPQVTVSPLAGPEPRGNGGPPPPQHRDR